MTIGRDRDAPNVHNWPVEPITELDERCPPLLRTAITQEEAERLAAAMRVLADPARLRLLSLLESQPEREACVCHLTTPLGLAQATVSHHLKVLHDAGLVRREQRGSWAFYSVVEDGLAALRSVLS